MESLLTNLADELLVQDITEPSAVLGPLSDDDLEAAYDFVLEQFALELLIGADKNSDWSNGNLVIAANFPFLQPPPEPGTASLSLCASLQTMAPDADFFFHLVEQDAQIYRLRESRRPHRRTTA